MKKYVPEKVVGISAIAWLVIAFGVAAASKATAVEIGGQEGIKVAVASEAERIKQVSVEQWLEAEARDRDALQGRLLAEMKISFDVGATAAQAD